MKPFESKNVAMDGTDPQSAEAAMLHPLRMGYLIPGPEGSNTMIRSLSLFCSLCVASTALGQEQYGFPRTEFDIGPAKAFLIHPKKLPKDGSRPWVWYAPTLPKFPNDANEFVLKQLLDKGYTVGGINVGESLGSPDGRKRFTAFYEKVVKEYMLDPQVNLIGQSRGAPQAFNWAVEHPEKVRAFLGIYPVCDLRSFPGLEKAAPAYRMKPEELEKDLDKHNPIDRLEPLAKAKVPMLLIHGGADKTVPVEANSKVVADRYAKLGGPVQLIVVPGKMHTEAPEIFREPRLAQFLIEGKLPAKKK